ncbi:MAG: SusC/RagA family TonB-linked outer membrane protein [Bacteroidetes bacterium 4572_77]|nr:MAG: SusC/RagA family TonB-linked outer membrane protein [Bacteroidetes bacterium 4572_77]
MKHTLPNTLKTKNLNKGETWIKVFSLLVIFAITQFPIRASTAQNDKISLKLENVSIKDILKEIENQCELTFVYNDTKVDVTKRIDVDFRELELNKVLKTISEEINVDYEIKDNNIILTPKNQSQKPKADESGIKITGTVTILGEGSSLPGVSVLEKDTKNGTVTNMDGHYSITVSNMEAILVFSYIGFESVEMPANKMVVNIKMKQNIESLDEMVIVGYGKESKKLLTGSVSVIGATDITSKPISNINEAMQGKSTGVQVVSNSGTPGGGISVKIRGVSSINAGSEPLYVIDGIPVITGDYSQIGFSGQTINAVSDINPNDIESISVLKDAAAATIYGARSSNGVVLITTKKGALQQKTRINFSTYYGVQEVVNKLDMLNATEFMKYKNEASISAGGLAIYSQEQIDNNTIDTDWLNEVLQIAPISNYELSATGGTKKTKFFISGGYFNQQGTLIGTGYERLNGRVNIDYKVNNWMNIGANIGLSYSKNNRKEGDQSLNSPLANAIAMPSIYPVYNPDGTYNDDGPFANPVSIGNLHINEGFTFRNIANVYADFNIAEGLSFSTKIAADYYNLREHTYDPPTTRQGGKYNGLGIESTNNVINIVNNNILKYEFELNSSHHFRTLAGYSFEKYERRSTYLRGQNFPNENFQWIASAANITEGSASALNKGLNSYFGEMKYDFNYKYLFTLSGRFDGSSNFGENHRYGFFPAASAAWRVSMEDFFNVSAIDDFKIRASYGITGNDGIPSFKSLNLYSSGANYLGEPGIYPSQLPNPDLRWESTAQLDIGFDMSFLDNRISITFDYYNKYTKDLLLYRPIPQSSGFSSIISNIGEMKNNGVELSLSAKIIDSDFIWSFTTNLSHNKNEITKLYNNQPIEQIGRGENSVRVGEPIGVFYNYESLGVDPSTGDLVFNDIDGDGKITENDRKVIGDPNPDLFGGITNEFSYNNFTLSLFFQFSYGNDVFNGTRRYIESMKGQDNQLHDIINRWRQAGDISSIPRATTADLNNNDRASSRFIEDGSYMRLKNLKLSYNFNKKWLNKIKINKFEVYIMTQNLLTFTNYSGMDPEVNYAGTDNLRYGTDFFTYPSARTISFGLNLGL